MTDLYEVLGVESDANDDDIRRAYKRLAMKYHPDKNAGDAASAAVFQSVCHAYQTLSDPSARLQYDQFGRPGASTNRSAFDYFHEFTRNTAGMGMGMAGPGGVPFGFGSPCGYDNSPHEFSTPSDQSPQPKLQPVKHRIMCTLEELYNGATKKMKVSKRELDATGRSRSVEQVLTVTIKPGWRKDTKITFSGRANDGTAQDVVFVLDEVPHARFTRDNDNLEMRCPVSLTEALCGVAISFRHLDGREITHRITDLISPGFRVVVPGEGMPSSKSRARGDLVLIFSVTFPQRLTAEQKRAIRDVLEPGTHRP